MVTAASLLPAEAPSTRLPVAAARAVLDLVQTEEPLRFVYGGVSGVDDQPLRFQPDATWIAGIGERLIGFTIEDQPRIVWQGDRRVRVQRTMQHWRSGCQITGGNWTGEATETSPRLLVSGTALSRYRKYFAPLIAFCADPRPEG